MQFDDEVSSFEEMALLDHRLLTALNHAGYRRPTLVQSAVIPLALRGKDILANARIGSGKSLAYLIPIVQLTLLEKEATLKRGGKDASTLTANSNTQVRAIVLVHTQEMCTQVRKQVTSLLRECTSILSVKQLITRSDSISFIHDPADIVVSTPLQFISHTRSHDLDLSKIRILVVDDADLALGMGFSLQIQMIADNIQSVTSKANNPKRLVSEKHQFQGMLMTASLNADVESLKQRLLHKPAVIKLEDTSATPSASTDDSKSCSSSTTQNGAHQYFIDIEEADTVVPNSTMLHNPERVTFLYALLNYKLSGTQVVIFVNSIRTCYRLQVFLFLLNEAGALNPPRQARCLSGELPLSTRTRIINDFNSGAIDTLIVADESPEATVHLASALSAIGESKSKRNRKNANAPLQQNVVASLELQNVACVINYDIAPTIESYTHRVGQVSRGAAITFVSWTDRSLMKQINEALQQRGADPVGAYPFSRQDAMAFQYRLEGVLAACTPQIVGALRQKDVLSEISSDHSLTFLWQHDAAGLQLVLNKLRSMEGIEKKASVSRTLAHTPKYLAPSSVQTAKLDEAFVNAGFPKPPKLSQNRPPQQQPQQKQKQTQALTNGKKRKARKTGAPVHKLTKGKAWFSQV